MNKIIVVTSDEPCFQIKTGAPVVEMKQAKELCDKLAEGFFDKYEIPARVVKTVSVDFINTIWFYGYHVKHLQVHFFTINYSGKSLKIRKHNYESICRYFDKSAEYYEEFSQYNTIVDEPTNFLEDNFSQRYSDIFGYAAYYDVLNSFGKVKEID